LGCGGTIAKHIANGDKVSALIMVQFIVPHIKRTKKEPDMSFAKKEYTIGYAGELPDQKLDTIPILKINQIIEYTIKELKPTVVYTHSQHDVNKDHRLVFEATLVACRPVSGSPVKRLLSYEVPSSTEWAAEAFHPNVFVEIDFERKLEIVRPYRHEMRRWPHPRSLMGIRTLAMWRGVTIGVKYAEAFELVREIL
jgi:LmbE family N-acetylglucosaminyl deacetylase